MSQTNHLEGEVAVLKQSVASLAQNMNNFVQTQREENTRLYDSLSRLGERFAASIDEVKAAVANRGRITGQSVLSMLAVLISFAVAIGGFGNYFINQSASALAARVSQVDRDVANLHELHIHDQAATMTELKELRDRREADLREEIVRLRAKAEPK